VLPEPSLLDWLGLLARRRRFPAKRRRLKWKATWQFEQVAARLRPGDIAIDCGASNGHYLRLLAATGATVYAFEPDPHGFATLQELFMGTPDIHLREEAVGCEVKHVILHRHEKFSDDPDYYVHSSSVFTSTVNAPDAASVTVRQIDFPAFIAALQKPVSLLKMDIEGAEVPILESLFASGLIDRIQWVFAETHEVVIPELSKRTAALKRRVADERRSNISLDWV
jgi:FkbM family methyltransferase